MDKFINGISVIVSCYNKLPYIGQAIDSVFNQDIDYPIEVIVCDDASTDGSYQYLLKNYSAQVRLLYNDSNVGPAITRNKCLDIAKYRFIAFLDGDDIWLPNKLRVQMKHFDSRKNIVVFTNSRIVDQNGVFLKTRSVDGFRFSWSSLLKINPIPFSSAIVDRQLAADFRIPDIPKRQDYALWLNLLRKGDAINCGEPLIEYRLSPGSISRSWRVGLFYYNYKALRYSGKLSRIHSFCLLFFHVIAKIKQYYS